MSRRKLRRYLLALLIPVFAIGMLMVTADKAFASTGTPISQVSLKLEKITCGTQVVCNTEEQEDSMASGEGETYIKDDYYPQPQITAETAGVIIDSHILADSITVLCLLRRTSQNHV